MRREDDDDYGPAAQRERVAQQEAFIQRIEDLIGDDPDNAAAMLTNVILSLLARRHPGAKDAASKRSIKQNYADATEELIAERALDEDGLVLAVAMGVQMSLVALDYSPLSNVKSYADADDRFDDVDQRKSIGRAIEAAFDIACRHGLSPYGAAVTMILAAVFKARHAGVSGYQLVKPLMEAAQIALDGAGRVAPATPEFDAQMVEKLAEMMGVSKATAKKYVAKAKRVLFEEGQSMPTSPRKRGPKQ